MGQMKRRVALWTLTCLAVACGEGRAVLQADDSPMSFVKYVPANTPSIVIEVNWCKKGRENWGTGWKPAYGAVVRLIRMDTNQVEHTVRALRNPTNGKAEADFGVVEIGRIYRVEVTYEGFNGLFMKAQSNMTETVPSVALGSRNKGTQKGGKYRHRMLVPIPMP